MLPTAFSFFKRHAKKLLLALIILLSVTALPQLVYSDELDDINKEIARLTSELNQSLEATKPLENELLSIQKEITGIRGRVSSIENELVVKEKEIAEGYDDLEKQQGSLNESIKNFYIKSYYASPILAFLSATTASDITKLLGYHKAITNQDKILITNMALAVSSLEERKRSLEEEKVRLAAINSSLAEQEKKIAAVVGDAKRFQSELSGRIAELSARQTEIINARSGNFTATIGSGELADEYLSSAKGFRESAPAGTFAVFSFGGYTHRKGMSQYGARGRAQSGQNFQTILSAYYGKGPVGKDTGGTIKVSGHGEMDFEGRYLLGIAEMPSSWHPEALKAQAVAARTYAYRYKVEGREICTTEACQVFNSSKADNPPEAWRNAVNDTRGQVLEDVVTYYASTHGGFASPIGWDTTDGSGGDNFVDKAYDRLGNSPWLYKAWWRQGYSNSGNTCGRSNPWLSAEEMADIVNAAIALQTPGIDTGRITPVTTSCWGGNPYSMDELRNLVSSHGGIGSANSVSVSQGNGSTGSVTINGITLSGADFKRAFNLRAPGYLSIPQSGFAFFNIEKK